MIDTVQTGGMPPVIEDFGDGEEPEWVSGFWFRGKISEDNVRTASSTIKGLAHITIPGHDQGLAFGVKGHMDVAINDAAEQMRPLLGKIVMLPLVKVTLIPKNDAIRQLEQRRDIKSYDVTQTTLQILGLLNNEE